MSKRIIAIGDIHGGLKALVQLLEKIQPTPDDQLIFLGDYVDGWSESAQVIDLLLVLREKLPCIFIKGNHDAHCESWLMGQPLNPRWLTGHGYSTIRSYDSYSAAQKLAHLEFFRNMQYFHIDEANRLYVHGGFTAANGPVYEEDNAVLTKDRTLWELARLTANRAAGHPMAYPKKLQLFHEIYVGHTPTLNYNCFEPMNACNMWNIDTGAGFYGRLSAIDVTTKEVVQTDVVMTLYPGERGRN
ncbi:serine/threonine protein phosphatase 1 [Chitinophaga jiangningensis]|uniref:Serine/threonine protein phosphatase 1 n=1 Tax=Chitinophaga jiangningensis TaxID=1419482 RepID=A0A1M7K073_9BACT|nr:metallophosphoesterase family protein [Chitinophaga jiangningensis]SHM58605.1 serine/threonine protein phosphatase 1 [Chitinophaga jiangningensis]